MKKLLKDSRNRLQSLMLSMLAHPDCTEGSEFDDMTSSAQEMIDKIDEKLESDAVNQGREQESDLTKDQIEILNEMRNAIIVLSTNPTQQQFETAVLNLGSIVGKK